MALVREELGPDAIILSTRRVTDGVEVTAALGDANPKSPKDTRSERALAYHRAPENLVDTLSRGSLAFALSAAFKFVPIQLTGNSTPLLVGGPPGAGKTLTVARIATRLVMSGGKPMIITADGRRAGAAEQLAAFTRLLGLDLIVASHPASLAKALARRQQGTQVLIDLPGGCLFESSYRDETEALASTAAGRLALVLPAGLDPDEAGEIAQEYASAGAQHLIVTRTDTARRIGCVLSAAAVGLALSEVGVGPGAADGLIPLTPEWLARRILQEPSSWNEL